MFRWKDDNWRLTRKMLNILLDPQHTLLRCSLWVRNGEVPVGGSKIEYQTQLARMTLEGWEFWAHVEEDGRWYGNRVKDWMHKYAGRVLPEGPRQYEKGSREAVCVQAPEALCGL